MFLKVLYFSKSSNTPMWKAHFWSTFCVHTCVLVRLYKVNNICTRSTISVQIDKQKYEPENTFLLYRVLLKQCDMAKNTDTPNFWAHVTFLGSFYVQTVNDIKNQLNSTKYWVVTYTAVVLLSRYLLLHHVSCIWACQVWQIFHMFNMFNSHAKFLQVSGLL